MSMPGVVKQSAAFALALIMALTCAPACGYAAETEGGGGQAAQLVTVSDAQGSAVSLNQIDPRDYDGYVCVLKEDVTEEQIDQIEENIEEIDDAEVAEEVCSGEIYAAESLETIEEIADLSAIDYIEPNYLFRIDYTADPFDFYNAGMINTIGIKDVWNAGVLGAGIGGAKTPVIAVMDTGLAGFNTQSRRHEDLDFSRIPYGLRAGSFSSIEDYNGHGTFVIGEILATMENHRGISGMMPKAQIVPVKVLNNSGMGDLKSIVSALNKLTKKHNVDVVNMSFSAAYYSASFDKACRKAARKGMILVAAAGNNGDPSFRYPAAYDSVIGVSAVKSNGAKWSYSEYNDSVDVAAPGVGVAGLSIYSPKTYEQQSGTSMAAPVISAAAAMVKSIDPSVKHNQFVNILAKTSKDQGKKGYDVHYGLGVVNFAKAYSYVKANKGRIPAVKVKKSQKPKKAKIRKLKVRKKSVTIKVKKIKKATSYQVAIRPKGGKTTKLRFAKRKFTILGFSRKSTYYIKVRAVRNVNGVNVYGKWSKQKKIKTK
ncbi:MAG: S8 family serine peptidase [Firmicutes bacterium]|nr:S8 family serine peptidase [Bacillota bacterium]